METVGQQPESRASPTPGARGAVADLGLGFALSFGAVLATWRLLALPASYLLLGLALYAATAALVSRALPPDHPGPGMGPANRWTLGRAALATPVLALSVHPTTAFSTAALWWIIVISTVALALDGVDGRVARRTGTSSAFGARFDMELDAALIMALSLLVWRSGRVGAWVLLIGLMRYAFVAAGWVWPALTAELPPSQRRKVVCVVQGVTLLVALGPIIPTWAAVAAAAVGLAGLVWSFAVDTVWAVNHGGAEADA